MPEMRRERCMGNAAASALNPTRLNEAINVPLPTDKNDPVPGRIRLIPFELVRRDFDFRSDINMRPVSWFVRSVVSDLAICLAVSCVVVIAPIGVAFAAA